MNIIISLSSSEILSLLCLLGLSVIVVSYLLRFQLQRLLINKKSRKINSIPIKAQWDAYRQSTLQGSLACSIGAIVVVLSWTNNQDFNKIAYSEVPIDIEEIHIPPTRFPPPAPPLPPPSLIIEEVIEPQDEDDYLFPDQDITEDAAIEVPQELEQLITEEAPYVDANREEPEENNELIGLAEQMPRFPACEEMEGNDDDKMKCGQQKLVDLLYKNLRYPPLAMENNVEGMCVVQFKVNKDGSIDDLKLVRDIGAGCGEASLEAVQEVIGAYGLWVPGRQRGRAVRVLYTLPIKFKLEPR